MNRNYRKALLFSSLLFGGGKMFAQNIAVNTTGSAAAAANLFEVTQPATAPSDYIGIFARNLSTGTNAYAIWAEATGAATGKYAIVVPSAGGNVGIGTITPSSLLTVNNSLIANSYFSTYVASAENINSSSTSTTASEAASMIINTPLPAANSSAYNLALIANARVPGGALNYGTLHGTYSLASFNGTGTLTTAYGTMGRAFNESTGTITTAVGAWNTANNLSTGTMGTAYGTFSRVNNGAGNTTTAYGLYADVASSGTVGTGYGAYIGTVAATSKYSLYASDATAPNYFAGNVGIGTAATAPANLLHVIGSNDNNVNYYSQQRIDGTGAYPLNIAGISLNPNAAGVQSHIRFLENGTPKVQIRFNNGNVADNKLKIYSWTTGTDFVTFDAANGNVGMGTTTPAYRLDLNSGTFGFGSANVRTETRNDAGLQGNAGAQSGFFETGAPVNYPAGAVSWWHLIDSRHSNNGNNYAMQFAGSFFDQNLYFRKTNGSPTTAWSQILTSGTGWMLTGNAGTSAATNFIGTTDAIDWVVKTTNTERMRVLAAGNVGIGTAAPAQKLDVRGNINLPDNGSQIIFPEVSGNTAYHGLTDGNGFLADGVPWYGGVGREPGAWVHPYPDYVISNHTGIRLAAHSNYGGVSFYEQLGPTGVWNTWTSSGSEIARFRADPWGGSYFLCNVGIGITVPLQKLDVQGGNARVNNAFIGDVGHGASWAGFSHYSQASASGYAMISSNDGNYTLINKLNTGAGFIGFRVSNVDQMVILNNGNVGIGTTGPAAHLEVRDATSGVNSLTVTKDFSGFGNTNSAFIGGTDAAGYGNTGIYVAQKDGLGFNTNTSFILNVVNNTASHMVVTGFGRVGIGTTTPTEQLEISKNFRLPATTGSTVGVIYSGANRYIHNYGSNNFFAGVNAGNFTMTGNWNTGVGYEALASNTSGIFNTATGYHALYANPAGSYNTADGWGALAANTSGGTNAAFGYGAASANTTGGVNTAIGSQALTFNTTGNYNVAVGWQSYPDLSFAGTYDNSIHVGANGGLNIGASNQVRIGNTSHNSIGGQVGWSTLSDARIKSNVQENVPGLSFINELRPVTYNYDIKKEAELSGLRDTARWQGKYDIEKVQFSGFLAQEVDAAAKKIGYSFSGVDKSGTLWALRYAEFVVPLVKSVQELNARSEAQQKTIEQLLKRIEVLENSRNASPK